MLTTKVHGSTNAAIATCAASGPWQHSEVLEILRGYLVAKMSSLLVSWVLRNLFRELITEITGVNYSKL